MQVTEERGYREYISPDGKRYRSVTGILQSTKTAKDKLSIQNWRMKKGPEAADLVFNNACIRGTFAHQCAESFLKGEDVVLDYEPGIPYWESLRKGLTPITDVISMEQAVSHPIGYAGRYDCFGTFAGIENTIIDFKTSDKVKKREFVTDYCLQLAAYAAGIKSTFGYQVNQGVLIIGIKDRHPQTIILSRDELLFYWKIWEKRVNLYHEKQAKMYIDNLSEVA